MVPPQGVISNAETALSKSWKSAIRFPQKDLEEQLTTELVEKLFDVFRDWSIIIDADVSSLKSKTETEEPSL